MTKRSKYLRHYTDLSVLFSLLAEKKLTLRDSRTWQDKNDSYYLSLYRKSKNLKAVLALCFVETPERYHFWQVFASGLSGVRIRFRTEALLSAVQKQPEIRAEHVEYVTLKRIGKVLPPQFPFVKRHGFEDEEEFRMVYEASDRISKFDVPIPLACIDNIKLNPWLHPDLFLHVKSAIKLVRGCRALRVVQSTLTDNERWKMAGDNALANFMKDK